MKAERSNREYVGFGSPCSLGPEPSPRHDSGTSGPGGLLPWPSLEWQQAALAGAVVLGLIVAVAGFASIDGSGDVMGGLVSGFIGIALVTMGLYAGIATRWLTKTSMAPLPAKVMGGVAIGLSITSVTIVVSVVIVVLFAPMSGITSGLDWRSGGRD